MAGGYSAKIVKDKNADQTEITILSTSYYMSTLGTMSEDIVERYIENQYVQTENEGANSSHG